MSTSFVEFYQLDVPQAVGVGQPLRVGNFSQKHIQWSAYQPTTAVVAFEVSIDGVNWNQSGSDLTLTAYQGSNFRGISEPAMWLRVRVKSFVSGQIGAWLAGLNVMEG